MLVEALMDRCVVDRLCQLSKSMVHSKSSASPFGTLKQTNTVGQSSLSASLTKTPQGFPSTPSNLSRSTPNPKTPLCNMTTAAGTLSPVLSESLGNVDVTPGGQGQEPEETKTELRVSDLVPVCLFSFYDKGFFKNMFTYYTYYYITYYSKICLHM